MITEHAPADVLVSSIANRVALDDTDRAAIRAMPFRLRHYDARTYLLRQGGRPEHCAFILSGFAVRQKLTFMGARQILGFLLPGEFSDLQQLFLSRSDHNVQALTSLEVAECAIPDLQHLAMSRPAVGQALWISTLVEASMVRENMLNIGRRDGLTRVAHLLCEFESRLPEAGLEDHGYDLPMTQEEIGDAVGLTAVHVNRTLKQLEAEGLIARTRRFVRVVDRKRLLARADFDPDYLHRDQPVFEFAG
nr:Crp/Fnr family transcriptional regulator [Sphingomonas sp. GC_Shp_6]